MSKRNTMGVIEQQLFQERPVPTPRQSEVAIRVQSLSKCYLMYDKPQDRLKQSLYPRLQRLARRAPRQYFREFWALKDVSFEVKKGETVGIIGRNGSGKRRCIMLPFKGYCSTTAIKLCTLMEQRFGALILAGSQKAPHVVSLSTKAKSP